MESLWGVITVIGPILLAAALFWALLRNRQQRSRRSIEQTEKATRQLYDELHREDKQGGR